MNLRRWIKENRKAIDEAIRAKCSNIGRLNDEDRREWILNDESLYQWAYRKITER